MLKTVLKTVLNKDCTKNIDEVTEHENICKFSCTLYIALFSVLLTINVGIGTFFVYYKYIIIIKNSC